MLTKGEREAAFIRLEWLRGRGAEYIAVDLGDGWSWGEVVEVLERMGFQPFDGMGGLILSSVPWVGRRFDRLGLASLAVCAS